MDINSVLGNPKKNSGASQTSCERYSPDIEIGLTAKQVEDRVEQGLANTAVKSASKTVKQIVLGNIFTYFNMIFFAIAIILIAVGCYKDLSFMVVVVANTAIGIIQEINAKRTLDKLTLLSAPTAMTVRDGVKEEIPVEDLVLDDIVIFSSGNQVCADAVILSGEVSVNESLVTGESDEIRKRPGDSLLSGSFIVSGECTVKLDRVGSESFASKLTLDAKKIKKKQQPGMMKSLTLLIKIIGIIIIPFAITLFICQKNYTGLTTAQNVSSTAASVIGMIPEGLYLLTSIALAVGAVKLAKRNTLVHDMKCIETLARVDVLCLDKTGTITESEMNVGDVITVDPDINPENTEKLITEFVFNMANDNATMAALKKYFEDTAGCRKAQIVLGFSSATKYSAVSFSPEESYILGAPEFLLGNDYQSYKSIIDTRAERGERVVLFAEYVKPEDESRNIFSGGKLDCKVIPIALIALSNRIRPEAKQTFEYFAAQGVEIKVISGDNPITVSKAALDAGIKGAENYVDASTLTKDKIARAANEYTVFGRVTPEQKRLLIRALKKSGHTVAMTGDGVNDVLALKDADCSIAMAQGSEAASNVSDLVLLDSDFSSMPYIVEEGRQVINNIERSAALFLMKNIFSFLLSLAVLFISVKYSHSGISYPLTLTQIAWMSNLMIGLPSFILTLEPNHERVKGKFLSNVMFRAFPAAISAFLLVTFTLLFQFAFSIPSAEVTTISVILFGIISLVMLYRVCLPFNKIRYILFGSVSVLFLLAMLIDPWGLFSMSPLSFGSVLVLIVMILLSYPSAVVVAKLFDLGNTGINKLKAKFSGIFSHSSSKAQSKREKKEKKNKA